MEFRRTMAYPPAGALLNLRRSRAGRRGGRPRVGRDRQARSATGPAGRYRVLGPASAPLARLRGEHRFQILLKGRRAAMREAVQARARRALRHRALARHRGGRRPGQRDVRSEPRARNSEVARRSRSGSG